MPGDLGVEDAKLVLTIDPDVEAVNKAIRAMGDDVDKASKEAGKKAGPGLWESLFKPIKDNKNITSELLLAAIAGGPGIAGKAGGLIGGYYGGAAGAAIGGRVGEAAEGIPGAVGSAVAGPAKAVNYGLTSIGRSLTELQGKLGPIGLGFDVVTEGLTGVSNVIEKIPVVGTVLGPFTQTLTAVPGIFKEITGTLVDFAAKANPGMFHLWQQALDDTQGVIGQTFVPILELMKDGVRLFGDVLANILPNLGESRSALSEVREAFAEMREEVRAVLADIGPSIRELLIDGLRDLAHWGAIAARTIGLLAQRLRQYFGASAGDHEGGQPELRSALGASARPAQIGGIEDYQRQFQTAAYSAGGGGTVQDKQLSGILDIAATDEEAKNLLANIDSVWETAQSTFSNISTAVGQAAEFLKSIKDGVGVLVDLYRKTQGFLTPSDEKADKMARILNPGEADRGYRLDQQIKANRAAHPEYVYGR